MFGLRKLAIFTGKVLALVLVFSAAWVFVAPAYASLLAAVSDALLPDTTRIAAADTWLLIRTGAQLSPARLHSLPFQAGLVIVTALILATPGPAFRRRLKYVLGAVVLTFGFHVLSVIVITTKSPALRPLITLFASVGVHLFPLLIWGGVSARYWWPGRRTVPITTTQPES